MNTDIIFKIAAVGVIVSILNQILKHSGRDDQAFLTSLAGILIVLYWVIPYIVELFFVCSYVYKAHVRRDSVNNASDINSCCMLL